MNLYRDLLLFFNNHNGQWFSVRTLKQNFNTVKSEILERELDRLVNDNLIKRHQGPLSDGEDVSDVIEYAISTQGNDRAGQILENERNEETRTQENKWWRKVKRKVWAFIVAIGVLAGIAGDLFDARTKAVKWWKEISKDKPPVDVPEDTAAAAEPATSSVIAKDSSVSETPKKPVYKKVWTKQDASGYVFQETFNIKHPECKGCKEKDAIRYEGTFTLSDTGGRIYEVKQGSEENAPWTKPGLAGGQSTTILNTNTFQVVRYSWGPPGSINYIAFFEKEIETCVENCP